MSKLFISQQGWEFAHRFSEQIARFLQKMSESLVFCEKMSEWAILSKKRAIRSKKRAICSFAHFYSATWAIRSWSLICGEQPEQIAHGSSFLVSDLSDLLTSLTKKEGMSESLIF